jgi:hypothetical protein
VIRGLLGIGLALLGLLPLGTGVLLLTRTPFRVGLAVFTGIAAAMVLLPPLVYLGLPPSVPVVLVDRSPRTAGIPPSRAWRFGPDWLVER